MTVKTLFNNSFSTYSEDLSYRTDKLSYRTDKRIIDRVRAAIEPPYHLKTWNKRRQINGFLL